MKTTPDPESLRTNRRDFLKTSGGALASLALAAPLASPRPGYAAEDNTIRIALIGCGGRGTGAVANALSTKGPCKLVALADVFPQRVANIRKARMARKGALYPPHFPDLATKTTLARGKSFSSPSSQKHTLRRILPAPACI